ncbi:serine/threonine protein phosphatase [Streptomyces viridochromogenes]|uniref:non-specific serine/threonine protein kinase n=1 Tax=Streptomyces viridochromogenes TaxID=1938 RepID=A0A0J7ZIF1_STRVR|nr:serine/threonine-protein kinase [Streptomyces viridochromogenes]KMS75811.1 serine/threonine protein phosphatase [Streptomyces viridochromogenes]KOG17012.1 serine/threonine protein phosphatase [Streptomyces viridochromogenes]KOG18065.1 serine/threonine protein phosphatase [Streptomyces viridochromogenes]
MPSGSPTSGVGRVIAGRYLLLNRLGSGGMGHVWLAHDQRLACEVALKEIVFRDPAEADEREARVARARAEARHAAGLRGHPHVVTVHDVLEHEGLPWIVMEYVAGAINLRDLIEQHGPPAPAECARVGLAVLDALTAGHERGVMHRDVKPANILLAPDRTGAPHGRVLLTDYGISVQPDAGEKRYTLASVLVGTAGYLAPERVTGGAPTPATDLFSLGCTLYQAVEGRGPFDRESHLAQVTAVVMEEPRPAVRAGALGPVVRALLEKDPARRMSAAEAAAALSRIVTPEVDAYARTQTDLGSQPHWGGAPPGPAPDPAGFGPSLPVSDRAVSDRPRGAQGFGSLPEPPEPLGGPHDFRPVPDGPDGPSRTRPRVLHAVLAGLLGLALAGAGVWYAMARESDPAGGTGRPYGAAVGLAAPLKDGDCVLADWPGATAFKGTPRLSLDPSCREQAPDGQVMGFVTAASAAEARQEGPAACEERTEEVRERLADVRSFALVPTEAGFETAGRRTACLVLGANGPVYGPLGGHRQEGAAFADTATMQRRDCLDVRSRRDARLVSCADPHDEQVLGFTRLGADVTLSEARTESDTACAREVPPRDYGFDPSVYTAGSWTSEGAWKNGTHFAVCTVRKQNGGTMEGDEP